MFRKLVTHSFALLRSPAQPIDWLLTGLSQPPALLDDWLRQQFQQPTLERALYVASPALHEVWLVWNQNPNQLPTESARLALWRYLIRLSSRSTPFGLFAGVSNVTLDKTTEVTAGQAEGIPVIRPDSAWLSTLVEKLMRHPAIRFELRYRPNNSLYQLGNQFRYSDYTLENGQRSFFINSVEIDSSIQLVIAHTATLPNGILGNELIQFVMLNRAEERPEAIQLINELIDAHVLISELEPGVTGGSSFERVIQRLADLPAVADFARQLAMIHEQLNAPLASVATDKCVERLMQQLLGDDSLMGSARQVDLFRPAEAISIKSAIVQQIGKEVMELAALGTDHRSSAMSTFAQRYYARYGMQAQPLLVALDHETGIGYDTEQHSTGQSTLLQQLVDHLPLPPTHLTTDRLDNLRLAKLTAFLENGGHIQPVTESDLAEAARTAPTIPLARSWAVMGELYSDDAAGIDGGQYQFLVKSVAGPSAVSTMARFCAHDPELIKQVRQLTDWEARQYPDWLLAEIVHLPAGRVGNVLGRPTLRAYEIPYITPSSVDEEHTLPLADLWVHVPDGKSVELWSKKHNRRVLPRNTTAHNYHGSDQVYRFLSDLGRQEESTAFSWSWGALANQPRLPRLVYKHLIVARAQWNLTKRPNWLSADVMVADMQKQYGLPRLIALVDGDNELLLDLDAEPCRQVLFAEINKRASVRVVEWLATPDQCWLNRAGHQYTSELVIPFGLPQPSPLPQTSPFISLDDTIQRFFLPGSEWLYVKVYVGEQTANEVLKQVVSPLIDKAFNNGWIDHWFFIRYYDPEPHLRLRFHCLAGHDQDVLIELNNSLLHWVATGQVHRVQVDTYDRELERYGYRTIDLVEQLFWVDSKWNLQWIVVSDEVDEDSIWWIACRQADELMNAFGLSLADKYSLMTRLQERFLAENEADNQWRKLLNTHYREWEERVNQQPAPQLPPPNWKPTVQAIRARIDQFKTETPGVSELLPSLLHMLFNRFFTSGQRMSEGVVYHFLLRRYGAELGKMRGTALHKQEQFADHERAFAD